MTFAGRLGGAVGGLALWLGAHATKGALPGGRGGGTPPTQVSVPIEDLRSLCRAFKVYDTANFAQNMKKASRSDRPMSTSTVAVASIAIRSERAARWPRRPR